MELRAYSLTILKSSFILINRLSKFLFNKFLFSGLIKSFLNNKYFSKSPSFLDKKAIL